MTEPANIKAREAARYLGMEVRTLETLRRRGEGPPCWQATDGSTSTYYYRVEGLRTWIARRENGGVQSVAGLVAEIVERVLDLERTIPSKSIASESWLAEGRLQGAQEILAMVRDFETPLPRVVVADNTPKLREALGTERGSTDG